MPALLTSRSSRPKRSRHSVNRAATDPRGPHRPARRDHLRQRERRRLVEQPGPAPGGDDEPPLVGQRDRDHPAEPGASPGRDRHLLSSHGA